MPHSRKFHIISISLDVDGYEEIAELSEKLKLIYAESLPRSGLVWAAWDLIKRTNWRTKLNNSSLLIFALRQKSIWVFAYVTIVTEWET